MAYRHNSATVAQTYTQPLSLEGEMSMTLFYGVVMKVYIMVPCHLFESISQGAMIHLFSSLQLLQYVHIK